MTTAGIAFTGHCVNPVVLKFNVNFKHVLSSLRRAVEEREQKVTVLEECRNSVQQEATSLRSSMRELEKSHLQARRELQELRRQVKHN